MGQYKVALLVVSDTCYADATKDKSGPRLKELFATDQRVWNVVTTSICPDEIETIRKIIRDWVDDRRYDLVITSGGTGFSPRDVTPEAIIPLIEKHAPGLQYAMYQKSFSVTPMASMSRLVSGVRNRTLILAVPGSPKGAVENIEAVLGQLPHALALLAGSDSRQLHAEKQTKEEFSGEHGHSCHQHDRHEHETGFRSNDTSQPITKRARESPYAMTSVYDALESITTQTPRLQITKRSIHDPSLIGSIVARDYTAPEAVPAYRASIVDGYAVCASDGPGEYPVVAISQASAAESKSLQSGQIIRITTGAPLPEGADSVVMVEDTELLETTEDGHEELKVKILVSAVKDDNIREPGSDVKLGEMIVLKGERITGTGGEIGLLASVGLHEIEVYSRPVVGVLSTGDELVEPHADQKLGNGQIRDSNRASLLATIRAWNYEARDLGIAQDQAGDLADILRNALKTVDVIITTGGVSMGEKDLLKPSIERALSGTIHFGRVAMKPGKPTTFATVPHDGGEKLIFALPGNPASALVTFHLFVLPSLRAASGYAAANLPTVKVKLNAPIKLDPRPEYHRVNISCSNVGILCAQSTGMQRSSRIGSLKCNGLLCLPAKSPACTMLEAGAIVEAILIDSLQTGS